jgi:hypothetical protein
MDRRKLQYGGKEALKKHIEELSEVSDRLNDMAVNSSPASTGSTDPEDK